MRFTLSRLAFVSSAIMSASILFLLLKASRIIEPLGSRCVKFRFAPISHEAQKDRLQYIAMSEGLQLSEEGIESLLDVSDGDLRRSIMTL